MAPIKISVGTINYTDWLRVTAAPVGNETALVFEEWYDVPGLTFFYLLLPQAGNYVIKFYDAPSDGEAGLLLEPELILDSRAFLDQYEERWYTVGSLPVGATLNAEGTELTDPYLIGKIIDSYFKEQFRFLKAVDELSFNDTTGKIILLGTTLALNERFRVVIKNPVSISNSVGALFAGTVDVVIQDYTILAADINKRFRCIGSAANQSITLPSLLLVNNGDFVYIDNTVGGVALQPRILLPSTDRILFNGWDLSINEFAEFWASKGEAVRLMKTTTDAVAYWEVIGDYQGIHVGEKLYTTSRTNPNAKPNNNAKFTADELPRLMWWGKNILLDKIIDDSISSDSWVRPSDKPGVFAFNTDYTLLRMPDTQNIAVKHLKTFSFPFGADADRAYNAPGGFQEEKSPAHNHEETIGELPATIFGKGRILSNKGSYYNVESGKLDLTGPPTDDAGNLLSGDGAVKNVGYIEFTRV
jgi:hypothetical protein